MNPEFYLNEFVDTVSFSLILHFPQGYYILRRCCSHITIYADGKDVALWWSEFFSRRPSLGRSVFGLRKRGRGSDGTSNSDDGSRSGALQMGLIHAGSFFQVDDSFGADKTRIQQQQQLENSCCQLRKKPQRTNPLECASYWMGNQTKSVSKSYCFRFRHY